MSDEYFHEPTEEELADEEAEYCEAMAKEQYEYELAFPDRRRHDRRRRQADGIAKKAVLINLVMLLLGVCLGYYLVMREISHAVTEGLK